jgi:hypothetical protein
VQLSLRHPVPDRILAKSEAPQLLARHDAVLPPGKQPDRFPT